MWDGGYDEVWGEVGGQAWGWAAAGQGQGRVLFRDKCFAAKCGGGWGQAATKCWGVREGVGPSLGLGEARCGNQQKVWDELKYRHE